MENISLSLILAQLINVGLLFVIFYYTIGRRLSTIIEERRTLMKKLATIDAEYTAMIERAEGSKKEILEEARKKAQQFMRDSEHIAKLRAEEIRTKAHDDAMQILEGGKRDVEKERLSMLARMKEQIIDVSLRINEKMFTTEKASQEFIEKELKEIE